MKTFNKSVAVAAILLAGIVSLSASAVKADLTITSQTDVSVLPAPTAGAPGRPGGAPAAQYPQTVTTYIKGDKARTEVKGGEIRIYNGERQRTYFLNPTDKTYWIEDSGDSNRTSRFGTLKVDSTLTLNSADLAKPENSKTVAGSAAQKYVLAGTITVSFQRSTTDNNGAAAPGAGGNDANGAGRRSGRGGMGPVSMNGDIWVSSTVPLPTDNKFVLAALTGQLSSGGRNRSMASPLTDLVASLKGIPLKSKISATMTMRDTTRTVTTTYDVKSVSTDSIDDSLFRAPDDYAHVDPPRRGFGGRRGGDNGNGGAAGQGGVQQQNL